MYRIGAAAGIVLAGYLLLCAPSAAQPASSGAQSVAASSCLECHPGSAGGDGSHDFSRIPCAACHRGDAAQRDKSRAHAGMLAIPGNLADAALSCACHSSIVSRVQRSLMSNARGIVAVDRYVLGEAAALDSPHASMERLGASPADLHLAQMCSVCHLARPKKKPGPFAAADGGGGGCLACHLSRHPPASAAVPASAHARLDADVDDARCFPCHSGSSRISLSYSGLHETARTELPPGDRSLRALEDGRIVSAQPADIHHTRGLACIDCHPSADLMGDAKDHLHEEEAVSIDCRDCHRAAPPTTAAWQDLDAEAKVITQRRLGNAARSRRYVLTERGRQPLTNVFLNDASTAVLQGKLDHAVHALKAPSAQCSAIPGHARLTCQSCHSSWAPQCLGCHTKFDPVKRNWIELRGTFLAEPPTLGVTNRDGESRVDSFVPGMIMRLLRRGERSDSYRRLYARISPHTTAAAGRSCESCHQSSLALGLGRGTLELSPAPNRSGVAARFAAEYERSEEDGLPSDAWTGLAQTRGGAAATRHGMRPLNADEQARVLRVGLCLRCHAGDRDASIYRDFSRALAQRRPECRERSSMPPSAGAPQSPSPQSP